MNHFYSRTKLFITFSLFLTLQASLFSCFHPKPQASKENPARVLIFFKTSGFKHASIPKGIAAIQKLGGENDFLVDTTRNSAYFTQDSLKNYRAVIFLSTTHNVLNARQQVAFERYIQAGGGFVGIHAAADTEYDWPWYNKLVGAYFSSHPRSPNVRKATIEVVDTTHLATKGLPARWERTDEWYNYKSINPAIQVLARLYEKTYKGGTNGDNHPIAWYHAYDGGRAFYTGLGHTPETFADPLFLQHLLGGIRYALGPAQPLDFSRSYAVEVPEENRFVKTVLVNDLNEPLELAVARNGSVYYCERKGKLWTYDPATGKPSLVWEFQVQTDNGFGLLGLTLDPDFLQNKFVYVFYSPLKEKYKHYISRFTLREDHTLDPASEKILMQVPVDMEASFHQGGSLAFDKDKNLLITTGDNTGASAYAPLDERDGRLTHDAQRSAANTLDLRGKILRIHPEANGTYTIPEGNLFPQNTPKTRPEIYAMGLRNAYRVTAHPRTGSVYWAEVGPDAGKNGKEGPRGYDEFNQARQAGNFGWPYFIGDNQAYKAHDFAANKFGEAFKPGSPANHSVHNTGLQQLPPARKALVWYPYEESPDFADMGVGGRCAVAGEIYRFDKEAAPAGRFPEYYHNCWFVFDWIRNWAKVIRLDENENLVRVESFMPRTGDFRRPMDAAFGPDGAMYVLEYGSVYGADNEDARLVKIEFNGGNRKPVARAAASDSIGLAPFQVAFSSKATFDFDEEDKLSYEWIFDGSTVGFTQANPSFTYAANGVYQAILRVRDKAGAVGQDTIEIKVGNALPQVALELQDNKTFYWDPVGVKYAVAITDREDKPIDARKAKVYFDYHARPAKQEPPAGQQLLAAPETNSLGKALVAGSDCKACHTLDRITVGPSFMAVARRYQGDAGAADRLAKKIIAGGSGAWGDHSMSAHPQLSTADATQMAKYILSLAEGKKKRTSLPLQGTLKFKEHDQKENAIYTLNGYNKPVLTGHGKYTLIASYTDKGGNGVGPLTTTQAITFRSARLSPLEADEMHDVANWKNVLRKINHGSYFLFKDLDLTHIRQVSYRLSAEAQEGRIELHIDAPTGPLLSTASFKATGNWDKKTEVSAPLVSANGKHDVYFVVVKKQGPNKNILRLDWMEFKR